MNTVYRAYSPTRGEGGTPYADRARAVGQAGTRNQFTHTDTTLPADWIVQAGTITWEPPQ